MLGISRGTLRQALSILDEEGFIVRKHGSGTFINPHVLRLRVRADLPFRLTDLIENAGYKASVKGPLQRLPDCFPILEPRSYISRTQQKSCC